ncbi:hypothetical protein LCGC14_2375190, partial [marine sediment metagenome]
GGCYKCGEDQENPLPEYGDAPYGCPRCGSSRIIFSSAYDKPEGRPPTVDDPLRYFVLCLACKHEGQWADFKGSKSVQTRRTIMSNPLGMGHLIEGKVEQDPMTDRFNIQTVDTDGKPTTFDVQAALEALNGQGVRFTLVSLEDLAKLAKMVEDQGESVLGLGNVGGKG